MGRGRKRKNPEFVPAPWIPGSDSEEDLDIRVLAHHVHRGVHDPGEQVQRENSTGNDDQLQHVADELPPNVAEHDPLVQEPQIEHDPLVREQHAAQLGRTQRLLHLQGGASDNVENVELDLFVQEQQPEQLEHVQGLLHRQGGANDDVENFTPGILNILIQ